MTDQQFELFLNHAFSTDSRSAEELSKFLSVVEPVLARGGFRLARHEIYGVFEGYMVTDRPPSAVVTQSDRSNMRPSQRMTLMDQISSELQARFSYNEITAYLGGFTFPVREMNTVAITANGSSQRTSSNMRHQQCSWRLLKTLRLQCRASRTRNRLPTGEMVQGGFGSSSATSQNIRTKLHALRSALSPMPSMLSLHMRTYFRRLSGNQRSRRLSTRWMPFSPFIHPASQRVSGPSKKLASPLPEG
jgi:hypothetical protein